MPSVTIATSAIVAPLIVALVCLFAYRNLGGGRHLLFWASGHAALALPFAMLGFSARIDMPAWQSVLVITIGTAIFTVMMVFGTRVMTGREHRLGTALLVSLVLIVVVTAIQHAGGLAYYAATNLVSGIGLVYGGLLLLRQRTLLPAITGGILVARGILAGSYAILLVRQETGLDASMALSVFANLLTALGLVMIEFDNARQREVQAREDEHRARLFSETLIDAMPATMTYKDRDLRYRIVNRRMRETVPQATGELIGRTWSEIAGPDTAATIEAEDRRVMESGEPVSMEQGWAGPDGRRTIIWAMKVPLRDAGGKIQGVITCGIDITRLKETEAQLIEQREAAESASRTKTAFLANMSHELRTPLNAIIGFSDMLEAGYLGQLSGRQQEYAGHIRQSGHHLLQLVSDILDLSRLETGRLELEPETCSLAEIATAAFAMVAPQASRAGVTLKAPAGDLPILADRRALTQILVNLLGNAVKFNRQGGSVSLTALSHPQFVQLTIQDTGIGMTDEEMRAAMAAFQRIDAYRSRSNSGAGLGLSICRSLVERHGGHMELRSRPGIGTTVDVYLPV